MRLADLGRPGRLRGGAASSGVTYIELMIAVAVMAILATLILPTGMRMRRRAQEAELKRALERIRDAIDEYHRDWELGYIESDSEHGWPESLEELTEEITFHGPPPGQQQQDQSAGLGGLGQPIGGGPLPGAQGQGSTEPWPKIYLRAIPQDPFNRWDDEEWDTGGWKARSYDDDFDATSWGGDGVYDVYSSSDKLAIDGLSRYSEW